jgi:prepilin-type N-terminal cleavage/methylation domain-containing protein
MNRRGMTLVEVMMAVSVIVIAALGTLCYEYLCVNHVRFARSQLTATRVGQLLIEDWKSSGGSADYNPEDLHMGFALPTGLPAGNFVTTIDGLTLHIAMSHSDVATDAVAGVTLREINVVVKWRKDLGTGAVDNHDPGVNLTTYVRRDQ